MTFAIFGLPGVVLAILIPLTIREPVRGRLDTAQPSEQQAPAFSAVLKQFAARPALRYCVAGASVAAFAAYSILTFSAAFFIRTYQASLPEAGWFLGMTGGVSAGIGIFFSGMLTDRLARRDRRWAVWAPAIGLLLAAPLYIAGFLAPTKNAAMAILLVAPALQYIYLGPTMGLMHNMVTPRMRATATALLYLSVNLFGLGLGPTVTGLLSDRFAAAQFAEVLPGSRYDLQCLAGPAQPNTADALNMACASAAAHGIRWALVVTTLALILSAMLYLRAARTLRKDLS